MIRNTTKSKILTGSYKICDNFLSKGLGLMFKQQQCLIFKYDKEVNISLHMWFVFFPIDVLWLDSNLKVVHILKNFKPFSSYNPKILAKYVIEMPNGSIADISSKGTSIIPPICSGR